MRGPKNNVAELVLSARSKGRLMGGLGTCGNRDGILLFTVPMTRRRGAGESPSDDCEDADVVLLRADLVEGNDTLVADGRLKGTLFGNDYWKRMSTEHYIAKIIKSTFLGEGTTTEDLLR